jgi:hypothetical protein
MATIIDVPPGTDIGGLDMTLRKQALYRIRGRVIDSRTGMPPSSVRIRLTWRTAAGPGLFEPELNGTIGSYNPADGAFELRGILPGSYVLVATLGDSRASNFDPRSPDNKSPAAAAYAPVIVGAADAIGATLSLVSGASISARFTIEGPQPLAGSGIEKARVTLTNAIEGLPGREVNSYVPPNFPSAIGADGTFRFDNVLPGEYRLRVGNLPAGFYVKEARFGATDALTHPLEIGAAGSDTLTLVVSAGAAALSGTVTDEKEGKLNPQESVLVVLVPDRNRDRPELFHADISDSTGRFNFDEVAPGDYRVFAWTTLEPYAYFDPDVLRDALPYSTAVHVTERSSQHISVKIYAPR